MKVLHLLSSWKWTGPAEPALEGAALLAADPRLELTLAHASVTKGDNENHVEREALRLGLPRFEGLALPRHFSLGRLFGDVRRLGGHLRQEGYDLIHCHMGVDHLTAALACRSARVRMPIVRSWYGPEGPRGWREAWLLRSATAAALVPGRGARDKVGRWGGKRVRTELVLPPLDLVRFGLEGGDMRDQYICAPEDFVVGVVARMQPHRRWGLLLEAFRQALATRPELKLLILGRGPDWERLVYGPAKELGVAGRMILAGYRRGGEFDRSLRSMDALVFLMPGSDGTCRALRQVLACGVPAVAARRGLLPELVRDGETGRLVDDDPEQLATALTELAADRERTRAWGAEARRECQARYDPERWREQVVGLYADLAGSGK